MSDHNEKVRTRRLDDKSDYTLQRISIVACIEIKGLSKSLEKPATVRSDGIACTSTAQTDDLSAALRDTADDRRQASNLIVSTLSDQGFRVVRSVIEEPVKMLAKLDRRYNSRSTESKIGKMSELVSTRSAGVSESVPNHVEKMKGLVKQLRCVGKTLEDTLAIEVLVASVEVAELQPVIAAITTLTESDINWEEFTSRFIEKAQS